MPTPTSPSPSSFSLLRLKLPQDRYQDVAFVFHGTPKSSDRAAPLSLHLGAGKRSWRSENVAGLDSDVYVPSAEVVQARPCDGPMQRFASVPPRPRKSETVFKDLTVQSGPRMRTGNGRLLSILLAYMLVCVVSIPMLTAWCHPAVNPNGVCRTMLYRASPGLEPLHRRLPTWIANRVVPAPPPHPPFHGRSVALDIIPELSTLLEDPHAQLDESVLVVSLRPARVVPRRYGGPAAERWR